MISASNFMLEFYPFIFRLTTVIVAYLCQIYQLPLDKRKRRLISLFNQMKGYPMTKPLENKTALVTGASKGIGKATALRLARDGAAVLVNYSSDKSGAEKVVAEIIKNGGKGFAVHGDLSKLENIKKMFSEIDLIFKNNSLKNINILVNNAGVFPAGDLESTTEETFDHIFDINVKGLFFTTQEAVKRMAQGGRIINISSVVARLASSGLCAYAASKAAVDSLTMSLADELGRKKGIHVNSVRPGLIKTEGTSGMTQDAELVDHITKLTALGGIGEPEDIANTIAFLAGPDARWVSGKTIEVSGGYYL